MHGKQDPPHALFLPWPLRESRKYLGKLFGVCGSSASLAGNALAFAGVPQVPRETFWCLREFRKCLGKLFGVCGSSASLAGNALAFAGVPQVSRETFWCLREFRKSRGKYFGVCNTVANLSKSTLAVTARFSIGKPYMSRFLKVLLDRYTTHATLPEPPNEIQNSFYLWPQDLFTQ